MKSAQPATDPARAAAPQAGISSAGAQTTEQVLRELGVTLGGLAASDVAERSARYGPNAVSSHRARLVPVLWHQLRSPLLVLLVVAAVASYFVGERSDAVIIGVIVAVSVGLGFVNEYRAEKAAEALHAQIRHETVVRRDGHPVAVDVTELVPGDIVELKLGDVVPADLRLLEVAGLECDESVLTGESLPLEKDTAAVPEGTALAELSGCALMGTVVHAGSATGVVVSTGARTGFGAIAAGLSTHQLDTEFQVGLRKFSMLLVYVAGALTTSIFAVNVVLHKPILDALLFSLAIAVGITPQLLPAVVSTSLAAGSRRMSRRKVLVKRLVCIEDLGNVDVLFTDKTGTLTLGRIDYMRAVPAVGSDPGEVLRWGLLCTENTAAVGGNPLDQALWTSPGSVAQRAALAGHTTLGVLPFDHERRMVSVVVRDPAGHTVLVTKGAPETVLDRCTVVPPEARQALDAEFAAGNRVVAVATRPFPGGQPPAPADENGLTLLGFLVFLDPPKHDAAQSLRRLRDLGIAVKVVTGDNPAVAAKVCHDLGLGDGAALTGADLDRLDDTQLADAITRTTVFARVSPEHKARIVRVQRLSGGGVAFLGDGVNDALALHAADVGISVDSATDVAKDAADVILLEKDLDVLADGVTEGRRIFANTIKYVLMGTSSNFGNMFSAAGASLFLTFLPMLPSQILLNNLLYDTSQLAIPTDTVDEEQLRRPSHWDIGFIRRFMVFFGPLSSVFDFVTFGVMLWVFHSGPDQFRSGWFVESLATQTLVIFAIRTRRIPFFRSHPSLPLTLGALGVVTVGALLPATPLAATLGFSPLPGGFFAALAGMALGYLVLIEAGKRISTAPRARRRPGRDPTATAATFAAGPRTSAPSSEPAHLRMTTPVADHRDLNTYGRGDLSCGRVSRGALVDGAYREGDVEVDRAGRPRPDRPAGQRVRRIDFLTADVDGFRHAGAELARAGVVAYQPTLITSESGQTPPRSPRRTGKARSYPDGARILGAHLGGPLLSPRRAGTHPADLLRSPDLELTTRLPAAGPVTQVTLAPELPGAGPGHVPGPRRMPRSTGAPGWSPTSSTPCGRSPTATRASWARHCPETTSG